MQDSPYAFPTDLHRMVISLRTKKDDAARVELVYESKYKIAEKQNTVTMKKSRFSKLFDWYEVTFDLKDTRLAYVFKVYDFDGSYVYFSEDGPTDSYDFSLGFYNFFQYPYINEADIVRPVKWMEKAVFYQIFPDRFCMGDDKKDLSYINMKWGARPTPKSFAGGDIKGITKKIGYLKELGINAIYLTPVFKSKSNHKYDISDFYEIDPMFGTKEDLHALVTAAHENDMKIVLDAVFNHISEDSKEFKDVLEKGRASKYFDWFIINGDKPVKKPLNYECFASCTYMPKLNTSNPSVQDFLTGVALYYIKEFDIDGWRLDVSDEISDDYWRKFRIAVKSAKSDAVIIGENWHDAYRNLRGDQYDGIMNYAFTKAMLDYFAFDTEDAYGTACKLNELIMRNKDGINRMMLNLLDSHDTHRFFTQIKENRRAMKEALAILFFYPGAPCIFYGTEILTSGGYDPDCRKCMDWEKTDENGEYKDIYKLIRKLSDLRRNSDLSTGKYEFTAENDMLIINSVTENHTYTLIVNHTENAGKFYDTEIGPESFVIFKDRERYVYE